MNKFELVTSKSVLKDKFPVSEIDYSILLAHVFGEPIKTEQAFMYLFRRYGLPNAPHDDYKDLCAYIFHTAEKDIIVRWCMNPGDYHYHLCAFVKKTDYIDYAWRPGWEWHGQIQKMAEKDGLVYFGGKEPFTLWKEEGGKIVWVGNDIQKAAVDTICKDYSDEDADAWSKVFDRMSENDRVIQDKYQSILPYPKSDYQPGASWQCQFCRQVEAGKEQHEWIMSLPEKSFLRRVYFSAIGLFEDWKRPTYIRDQNFDLTCRDLDGPEKDVAEYTDFYLQIQKNNRKEAGR